MTPIDQGDSSRDRVTALPGIGPLDTVQFAGYASIHPGGQNNPADSGEALFYWFAGAEDYCHKPTILWSNGGPGSSSLWGFFIENGPYRFAAEGAKGCPGEPEPNPDSWTREANYLVFEHPLGVSLSFARDEGVLPQNVGEGIAQLYEALVNFIALHPEIAENPLILAGESYAGTYLPLLAEAILRGNETPGRPRLALATVVLGDAWVDPTTQMATDTEYAVSHGLITPAQKARLDAQYEHNYPQVNQAIQALCGLYMANTAQLADPPFQPVLDYINRADVRAAIHVTQTTPVTRSWSPEISNLYAFGVNDSYLSTVQGLLDQGVQTLVISGLNDAKDCNFLGTQAWLMRLSGTAAAAFHAAPTELWREPGDANPPGPVLGFVQGSLLLTWVKVLNAGHLAVHDQPRLLDLLRRVSRAWK